MCTGQADVLYDGKSTYSYASPSSTPPHPQQVPHRASEPTRVRGMGVVAFVLGTHTEVTETKRKRLSKGNGFWN